MKSFLSRYLKFIIGSVVALAVLISVGIISIGNQTEVERMSCTYTLTKFDYIVTSPSEDQIEAFENSSSVEAVFPFYTLKNASLKGSRTSSDITVLGADSLDGYSIGFFSEENLVEGAANSNGIMLDETAAEALGVEVGDTVSFTVVNQTVTVNVCAIYLACTYDNYDEGLALMVFDDDIKAATTSFRYYQGAFIQAADANCASLITGYIPWARFYSSYGTKDEYVAKKIAALSDMSKEIKTEAEWTEYYEAEYDELYNSYASGKYTETTDKAEQYSLIYYKVEDLQESTDSLVNIVSWAVAGALCLLMIIFIITNKGNDSRLIQDGASFGKMFLGYLLLSVLCVGLTAAITFGVLWIYAGTSFFASACTSIIMKFALLPLIALPVAVITALVYLKILYR